MKRIVHVTDPHFDCIVQQRYSEIRDIERIDKFANQILESGAEAIIVSGDISHSTHFDSDLTLLNLYTKLPIYFVLGNHDYYLGLFENTESKAKIFSDSQPDIKWLESEEIIQLSEKTGLIGADGWYSIDTGLGADSRLLMTDFTAIHDFVYKPHLDIVIKSRLRAERSAKLVEEKINKAVERFDNIYIVTHVPPFPDSSLSPQRMRSNGTWSPYMVNSFLGAKLAELAESYRDKNFVVFCGHTHTDCTYVHSHNLKVEVGLADYGNLMFKTFDIE